MTSLVTFNETQIVDLLKKQITALKEKKSPEEARFLASYARMELRTGNPHKPGGVELMSVYYNCIIEFQHARRGTVLHVTSNTPKNTDGGTYGIPLGRSNVIYNEDMGALIITLKSGTLFIYMQ